MSLWNGGGQQFPTFKKNYDEDINELCYAKSDSDLLNWYNNTQSLVKRLILNPDVTKKDPQSLIDKLDNRCETMKLHLIKRGILTGTPGPMKGIVKATPTYTNKGTQTPKLELTVAVPMKEKPMEPIVFQPGAYMLRRPPPHLRKDFSEEPEEVDTLLCEETLTQRIEKEPEIHIK